MRTETFNVYTFEELSAEAQQKAIEAESRGNAEDFDNFWGSDILADYERVLEAIGFSNVNISYTGFCSQGDGASFTGYYEFHGDWREKLENAFGDVAFSNSQRQDFVEYAEALEAEQQEFAKELDDICQLMTFEVSRSSHHYVHEKTITVSEIVGDKLDEDGEYDEYYYDQDQCIEIVRGISRDIYSALSDEYDAVTGEEYCREHLKEDDREYFNSGKGYSPTL